MFFNLLNMQIPGVILVLVNKFTTDKMSYEDDCNSILEGKEFDFVIKDKQLEITESILQRHDKLGYYQLDSARPVAIIFHL